MSGMDLFAGEEVTSSVGVRVYRIGDYGTVTVDLSNLTVSALPPRIRDGLFAALDSLADLETGPGR